MTAAQLRQNLLKKLGKDFDWPIDGKAHGDRLARGIRVLAKQAIPRSKWRLQGQPFDDALLYLSPLFRRSRRTYLEGGGSFEGALLTSARSLSSIGLLDQHIEFSPIEKEMVWAADDLIQRKDLEYLLHLRTYSSSLFHEQNHRILWRILPPPPSTPAKGFTRRYLNFAESLVIASDMALGDELGPRIAPLFYLSGVTYDPGTPLRKEGLTRRMYRNYLQAVTLGTYLTLELYSVEWIRQILKIQFPMLGELAERAADRSVKLDPQFITITNLTWQDRSMKWVSRKLEKKGVAPLLLSDNPEDARLQYLMGEKWFESLGL